jgi:hypothetical protein
MDTKAIARFRELHAELSGPAGVVRLPFALTPDKAMLMDDSGDHLVCMTLGHRGQSAVPEGISAYFEPPLAEFLLLAVQMAGFCSEHWDLTSIFNMQQVVSFCRAYFAATSEVEKLMNTRITPEMGYEERKALQDALIAARGRMVETQQAARQACQ